MSRILIVLSFIVVLPASAQELTVEEIMQDPDKWVGGWPSMPYWNETGDTLYFEWNPKGAYPSDSLFRYTFDGGPEMVSFKERRRRGPSFDGWHHGEDIYDEGFHRKVYEREGDLFLYDRSSRIERRITRTRERETNPRFSGEDIVFQSGNNLYLLSPHGTRLQLTDLRPGSESTPASRDEQDRLLEEQQLELMETLRRRREEREAGKRDDDEWPPAFYFGRKDLRQLTIDPSQRWVTFFLSEPSPTEKETKVPQYVTESGYVETSTARAKVGSIPSAFELYVQDLDRDTTYQVRLSQVLDDTTAKHMLYGYGPFWSNDGSFAVVEIRTRANKDRWIAQLQPESARLKILDHQHDEAWIQAPGIASQGGTSEMGWLADGRTFYFQSEKTGRSHLYTVEASGRVRQITQGDFDVYDPLVSRDGASWFFGSNEESPFERHFYKMPIEGGRRTRLTAMPGWNEVALNPDERTLAIRHSTTNRPPDLYVQREAPERITTSPTEEWSAYPWRDPEIITFDASDGVQVPAHLFVPDKPNGAAVLFVHGAGYLQNVFRGWSGNYYREYMFHNLLADAGYYVMNVDFRGSAGYGRDWRTAVYRHMGGRDLQDYVDASDYLNREYGIDPERVFIYGGSYGGFITLMALFTEPEHFGGGAALRSVTDWAHYHHTYTANILNTPAEDSIAFRRSSPIYFAEGLEDPLLIAHGMIDDNVQFQDVVRLAQRLIELGKEDWELAVYPLEKHSFEEPESWTDEYKRIMKYIRLSVGPRDAAAEEIPFLRGGVQ